MKKDSERKQNATEKLREQKAADAGVGAAATHGWAADEGCAGSTTAVPVVKNLVAHFDGRELGDLVKEALTGRPQKTVDSDMRRLAKLGVVCVDDIQALAEDQGTPKDLRVWLKEHSKLPYVTCMRLSRFLFESAHGPSPQGR